jgi:hypothetical protein
MVTKQTGAAESMLYKAHRIKWTYCKPHLKNYFYDANRKMKENKLTRNIKVRDHQFKQIYTTSWSSVAQWLVIERSLLCQIGLVLFSHERWLRYER